MPIVKARVHLIGAASAPREAFTDEKGSFRVEDLPVGRYQLFVTHVAHRDADPRFVDVVAGETAEANFQLQVLSVQTAYVSILPYTFYYNVAWCFPKEFGEYNSGVYCQALGWGANVTVNFLVDEASGPLMGLVHEMQWTAATPVCVAGMKGDLYSPEQTDLPNNGAMSDPARSPENPFHWENEKITSPTKTFVPREGSDVQAMWSAQRTELNGGKPIRLDGKWALLHWLDYAGGPAGLPVPLGCTIEERLEGYVSLFYVDPAPSADWTALPP